MRVPKPEVKDKRSWDPDFYTLDDIYIGKTSIRFIGKTSIIVML